MSRLYDAIAEQGLDDAPAQMENVIMRPDTVLVDVRNVSDYIRDTYHAHDYEKSWVPKDFPNIAPPWEHAFFEWPPEFLEYRASLERCGAFIAGYAYDEGITPGALTSEADRLKTEPRWFVTCSVVMKARLIKPRYMGSFALLADQTGAVCTYENSEVGSAPLLHAGTEAWNAQAAVVGSEHDLPQVCGPAFLGISFLHCKNVSTTLNEPPQRLQKKRVRKGKKPLKAYYTLAIEPMAQTLDREGAAKNTGIKQALHICRGHFATYSPGKPLFGKYAGTFWKPQHVRGSKSHGEIVKDYAVKAPNS